MQDAWTRARDGADPGQLEATLASWNNRFAADASDAERQTIAQAGRWLERERSRRQQLAELERSVPEGAVVRVVDEGDRRRHDCK